MFKKGDLIKVRDDAVRLEGRIYGITLNKSYEVLSYSRDDYGGVVCFLDDQGVERTRSAEYYQVCGHVRMTESAQAIEQERHESKINKSTNKNWGIF